MRTDRTPARGKPHGTRRYRLVVDITVTDLETLQVAAAENAAAAGFSEAERDDLRSSAAHDPIMLFNLPVESDCGCRLEEIEIEFDPEGSGRVN
jgi:hypothetical protein